MIPNSLVTLIPQFQRAGLALFVLCHLPPIYSSVGTHPTQAWLFTGPTPEKREMEQRNLPISWTENVQTWGQRVTMSPPGTGGAGDAGLEKTERKP